MSLSKGASPCLFVKIRRLTESTRKAKLDKSRPD